MTCLVLRHFVNGVVDSVKTGSLGVLCDAELVLASADLCCDACLKVRLRVAQNVAEELSELACVLCLLESIALVSLCNFRIALTVCLARHGEIHSDLCAFAVEMCVQILDHLLVSAGCLRYAEFMNCCECSLVVVLHLREL